MDKEDVNCSSYSYITKQLLDIFGNAVSLDILKDVCVKYNFQIEDCIAELIKYSEHCQSYLQEKLMIKKNFNVEEPTCIIKSKGTIPKNTKSSIYSNFSFISNNVKITDYPNILRKDFKQFISTSEIVAPIRENVISLKILSIIKNIKLGYKVMIIMRGAPGSGKTFLARYVLDHSAESDYKNHSFSSDDYFYNIHNEYIYNKDKLHEAHKSNQKNVRKRAAEGWSPIIVDNTNIKIWEMLPYVQIAVEYGYIITILQPCNNWCKSPSKLFAKNKHGVPKSKIEKMLKSFESITVEQLIEISGLRYAVQLPQMRRSPASSNYQINLDVVNPKKQLQQSDLKNKKQKRDANISMSSCSIPSAIKFGQRESFERNDAIEESYWKCDEEEGTDFWNQNSYLNVQQRTNANVPKSKRNSKKLTGDNIFSLIKYENEMQTSKKKLERHRLGCPNENKSFLMLRQTYNNVQLDCLWNLFEKCRGDINCAIDLILTSDVCIDQKTSNYECLLECHCNNDQSQLPFKFINVNENKDEDSFLEGALHNKKKKKKLRLSSQMPEAKCAMEKDVVLTEDYYSNTLNKIRDFQQKLDNNYSAEFIPETAYDDMVELRLGKDLIRQLESVFNKECNLKYSFSDFKTNVFMPRSVAKQLYALWMESLYNQIEEQKQGEIRGDEELARSLQNSFTCEKVSSVKNNNIYKSDSKCWRNSIPINLASYMTRLKLFELFPHIEKDIILEILSAHNNNFNDTIKVLKDSLKGKLEDNMHSKATNSIEHVCDEKNMVDSEDQTIRSRQSNSQIIVTELETEIAKKLTLKEFEESRNLAVHHSQLKAECYQKAKDAIQKDSHAVAIYYSEIANLHKNKIEKFNQRAANCIIKVQNSDQNHPDLIDLHYLHVLEAVECLDLFVDSHIRKLKNFCRACKFVFIITGRGLHSAGGVSAIKNKVKIRLKERNLT